MKAADAADRVHVDPTEREPIGGRATGKSNGKATSAPAAAPRVRSREALVDEILGRASEPWVCLGLDGAELARLRLGSWAALLGGPGAGKSTLAAALLAEHARLHGPAIYASLELGADELAARVIGMVVGASWEDVLRGQIQKDDMLEALPPRLIVLDRDVDDVTLTQLDAVVARVRADHPGLPILAAIDYIQLAAGDGPDVRTRVSAIAEAIRATARRLRIALVGVSQTSRAAHQALRAGELVGADTMAAGAESSGIERAAYVTMAIGGASPAAEAGVATVELHLGKGRFGGGDRVLPMLYEGRTGRWRVAGESRPAAEVSAARAAQGDARRTQAAMDAIYAAADRAPRPVSREDLRRAAAVNRAIATAAITTLLTEGRLAECERAVRSAVRLLWTPTKLAARAADQLAAGERRMGEAETTAAPLPPDIRPGGGGLDLTTAAPALYKGGSQSPVVSEAVVSTDSHGAAVAPSQATPALAVAVLPHAVATADDVPGIGGGGGTPRRKATDLWSRSGKGRPF